MTPMEGKILDSKLRSLYRKAYFTGLRMIAKEEALAKRERGTDKKKIAATQRAYREANKEEIAAAQREYYKTHKEGLAIKRRHKATQPEKIK